MKAIDSCMVSAAIANVRNGPSTSHTVLSQVNSGFQFGVGAWRCDESQSGYAWAQIEGNGWLRQDLLSCSPSISCGSPPPPASTSSRFDFPNTTKAGIHYVGGTSVSNRQLFGNKTGWALEVFRGTDESFIRNAQNFGYHVIVRVDQQEGQNIPMTGDESQLSNYKNKINFAIKHENTKAIVVGNEPNLDEECKDDQSICAPENYARFVAGLQSEYPEIPMLLAGPSPSPHAMILNKEWLARALKTSCPQGVALHAYAGIDTGNDSDWVNAAYNRFVDEITWQMNMVASLCSNTSIFITEFNAQPFRDLTNNGKSSEEAKAIVAQILSKVFTWAHNQPQIKGIFYFVFENRGNSWGDSYAVTPDDAIYKALSGFGSH